MKFFNFENRALFDNCYFKGRTEKSIIFKRRLKDVF